MSSPSVPLSQASESPEPDERPIRHEGHTPGPWTPKLTRTSCGIAWKIEPLGACLYVDTRGGVCNPDMSEAEASANAQLLAAAPDMLAALEAIAAMEGQTLLGPDSQHHMGPGAPRQYEHGANEAFGQAAQIASAALAKATSRE